MPFTDRIVKYINDSLKAGSLNDKRFQNGKYCGVSTLLARKNGNAIEVLPAVVDQNGEYKMIEPNDKFGIIIYHKVVANAYSFVKQQSFGDDNAVKCTTDMTMVVLADSRAVGLQAEALEPLIIFGLPLRLSDALKGELKLNSCLITPIGSTMDKIMVFKSEYPSTEYFLKPFHQLFSIRYRVEATFDKNCANNCLCGD